MKACGVRDLALLVLRRRLELRHALRALLDEVGVVADVLGRASVVQLDDPVGDLVDEVAVVADEDDRAGVVGQEALQPLDAGEVEVVGRLVEQQHVRVLEQEAGERDAHHPAAGELADVALDVRIGEAEPGEDPASLRLHAVAAERLEPMLEAAVLVDQLRELLVVVRVLHLGLDVAHPALDAAHLAGAGQYLGQHAATAALRHLLAQVADHDVAGAGDRPGVGLLVAGDELEQRRLAGAVGPDDRDRDARARSSGRRR